MIIIPFLDLCFSDFLIGGDMEFEVASVLIYTVSSVKSKRLAVRRHKSLVVH